jgi:hypothetical protein
MKQTDPNDLPLFRWTPPVKVILFPLDKRRGKVRHTAKILASKHGDEAELYGKQVLAGIRKHFDRVGVSKEEADRELRTFFDAVQAELLSITCRGRCPGGDAA